MLVRIVAMLTKLLMRFGPEQYPVHESAAGLARLSLLELLTVRQGS